MINRFDDEAILPRCGTSMDPTGPHTDTRVLVNHTLYGVCVRLCVNMRWSFRLMSNYRPTNWVCISLTCPPETFSWSGVLAVLKIRVTKSQSCTERVIQKFGKSNVLVDIISNNTFMWRANLDFRPLPLSQHLCKCTQQLHRVKPFACVSLTRHVRPHVYSVFVRFSSKYTRFLP